MACTRSTSGSVFSVGTNGTDYQNLVSFTGTGGAASGLNPGYGSLTIIGTTLYGTTVAGGSNGDGNIFSVGVNGSDYRNLLSFSGTGGAANGRYPNGSLTLAGTTFYGTTFRGGADGDGNIFSVGVNGSNYQNLLSFTGTSGAASGLDPLGSLLLSGTILYGMTPLGGAYGIGNIFSVGIDGSSYQDLYDFTGGADGGQPFGDLTLSGGTLFGMTYSAGDLSVTNFSISGVGTVFAYTLPTPEPGTLALAGAAAVASLSYRWRRKRPFRETRR